MAEILLVNPRRRKRRRMTAKQALYFGTRRRRRRRQENPSHLLAMNPVGGNPRRRRRRRSTARVTRRRRNPDGRLTLAGFTRQIMPTVQDGFTGALGGLGLDVLMGTVGRRLPPVLQTGFAKDAVKVVGGVLIGILGNMVLRGRGRALAVGAVTIALHDVLKAQMTTMLPRVPLGEFDYWNPGSPVFEQGAYLEDQTGGDSGYGAYVEDSVGEYDDSVGEYDDSVGEYADDLDL